MFSLQRELKEANGCTHDLDPEEEDDEDVPEEEKVDFGDLDELGFRCLPMLKKSTIREITKSRNFLSTDFLLESVDELDGEEPFDVESVIRNGFDIKEASDCTPVVASFFFILVITFRLSDVCSAEFLSSLRRLSAERTDFAILPHSVSASSPVGMLLMAFVMADGIMNGAAR